MNPLLSVTWGGFSLMLGLLVGACQSSPSQETRTETTLTEKRTVGALAQVGLQNLQPEDLAEYLEQRPLQIANEEEVRQRLEEMILSELLYREALRQRLEQQPAIRRRLQQVLIQQLWQQQVEEPVRNQSISEEEVQSYYQAHRQEFERPAQRQVATLFVARPFQASEAEIKALVQKTERLLSQAQEGRGENFGELIRQYSDRALGYALEDSGYFDIQGQPLGWPAALAEAAFRLERPGEITPQVIETPLGWHILMLINKRDAQPNQWQAVQGRIREKIQEERLQQAKNEFIRKIKAQNDWKLDSVALKQFWEKYRLAQSSNSLHVQHPPLLPE